MKFPRWMPELARAVLSRELKVRTDWIQLFDTEEIADQDRLQQHRSYLRECSEIADASDLEDRIVSRKRELAELEFVRRIALLDADEHRMADAYDILRKELQNDAQWVRYVAAACLSLHDYAHCRKQKRDAKKGVPCHQTTLSRDNKRAPLS